MQDQRNPVAKFFESTAREYDGLIERCVPRYYEMISALMGYVPRTFSIRDVLELGCGTGNLSGVLAGRFPTANICFVDVSVEMQAKCRARLGLSNRFTFETAEFQHIAYAPASFDLVASSISLHHLKPAEKAQLFRQIMQWLRADGIFTYSDQFSGATKDIYDLHMQQWRHEANALGATDEDWAVWMEHQAEFDYHDSLLDQVNWLRMAGYAVIDCPWRYLLWTVIQARKSSDVSLRRVKRQ